MSDTPEQPARPGPTSDGALGPEILQCRPRQRIRVWIDQGVPPIPLVLGPFVVAAVLTLVPGILAQKYFGMPPILKNAIVAGVTAAWFSLCLGGVFFYYLSARESDFSVHEEGFRYRQRPVRFDELTCIGIGLPESTLGQAAAALGQVLAPLSRHARGAVRVQALRADNSLTAQLSDGGLVIMKDVLIVYEEDDLETFFQQLAAKRPDLTRSAETNA